MAAKKKKRVVDAIKKRVDIPRTEKLFMVRRTLPGASYGKIALERGRLLRMQGFAKDQQLLRLGYIEEIIDPSFVVPSECGPCHAQFIGDEERNGHFERNHKDILLARERTVQELTEKERQNLLKKTGTYGPNDVGFTPQTTPQDQVFERIIERENEIAPLKLDKTAASRK